MTLGQNIQNARRVQGLSQEALAEKIGVSRQALGKWEKDTALPGLDNLQALAAALGIGVDALLGAENADPAVPAVTLDALRDLLAARDAEEKRRRRLWDCAGGAVFIVLAGLLAGVALQYERQISALNQNYAAIQSSYAAQQAELSAQISELQDAVRMGEATILDWRWLPVDKLHRDADKSWMPVQVQVTPRTTRDGVTARLAVRCGDDTQLYEMTAAPCPRWPTAVWCGSPCRTRRSGRTTSLRPRCWGWRRSTPACPKFSSPAPTTTRPCWPAMPTRCAGRTALPARRPRRCIWPISGSLLRPAAPQGCAHRRP